MPEASQSEAQHPARRHELAARSHVQPGARVEEQLRALPRGWRTAGSSPSVRSLCRLKPTISNQETRRAA